MPLCICACMRACASGVCLSVSVYVFEHTSLLCKTEVQTHLYKTEIQNLFLETLISLKYGKELSMPNKARQESKCSRDPFLPD